jgi:ATP adenylyltransferase
MDHLWSPWRLDYVTGRTETPGCVFCRAAAGGEQADLVVYQGAGCFVILNLYPYNNGHLMVVPNRHLASLADASSAELGELIELTRRAEVALTEAYAPHGLNMGINLGKPAGAGVLDHVHLHVVPRWNGDTNFMTVVGGTRVLPEELLHSAARLRPLFERLAQDADEKPAPRPEARS